MPFIIKVLYLAYVNQRFEDKPDFLNIYHNKNSVMKKDCTFDKMLIIYVWFKEMISQIFKQKKIESSGLTGSRVR